MWSLSATRRDWETVGKKEKARGKEEKKPQFRNRDRYIERRLIVGVKRVVTEPRDDTGLRASKWLGREFETHFPAGTRWGKKAIS